MARAGSNRSRRAKKSVICFNHHVAGLLLLLFGLFLNEVTEPLWLICPERRLFRCSADLLLLRGTILSGRSSVLIAAARSATGKELLGSDVASPWVCWEPRPPRGHEEMPSRTPWHPGDFSPLPCDVELQSSCSSCHVVLRTKLKAFTLLVSDEVILEGVFQSNSVWLNITSTNLQVQHLNESRRGNYLAVWRSGGTTS